MEQMKLDDCKPLEHLNDQINRINQASAKKTLEADRILEAYKIGAIDLPKLKDTMDEIKIQEAKLVREKESLEAELQKAKTQELSEERLNDFCNSLPSVLTSLDYNQRRQILKEVVDKIVIDGETVKIYGIIKPSLENVEDTDIVLHSSKGDTEGFIVDSAHLLRKVSSSLRQNGG
jgi:chromosome segregation ATPase